VAERAQERRFGLAAVLALQQVADFGDDRLGTSQGRRAAANIATQRSWS
jgi:hypothetical protein